MNSTAIVDDLREWETLWADLRYAATELGAVLPAAAPEGGVVQNWEQTINRGIAEIKRGEEEIQRTGSPDQELLQVEALIAGIHASRYDPVVGAWTVWSVPLLKAHRLQAEQFTSQLRAVGKFGLEFRQRIRALRSNLIGTIDRVADTVRLAGNTVTESVKDATAYPLLTQSSSYPSSSIGAGNGNTADSSLGQVATKAISDVLGWKLKGDDGKGFIGALTSAFTCTEVEGRTECVWTPRTYAVQTDLGGGLTGAQASLYTRAKDAIDKAMKLLDGLKPLRPDADEEYIKAARELVRNQFTQLTSELGLAGGPKVTRVDQIFSLLLGQPPVLPVQYDPDRVTGQVGTLRRVLGLARQQQNLLGQPPEAGGFVNTIEDEQDQTNFRIIVDYLTSLMQSWIENRPFFTRTAPQAFMGTQLVLVSRQLSVVAESVNEVRSALDSLFVGPEEQQTVPIDFQKVGVGLPPMFVDELLSWIRDFATAEGPQIAQDSGGFGIQNSLIPILQNSLLPAVGVLVKPAAALKLPRAFKTPRFQTAIADLHNQLTGLLNLVQRVPAPSF